MPGFLAGVHLAASHTTPAAADAGLPEPSSFRLCVELIGDPSKDRRGSPPVEAGGLADGGGETRVGEINSESAARDIGIDTRPDAPKRSWPPQGPQGPATLDVQGGVGGGCHGFWAERGLFGEGETTKGRK